MINAGKIVWIHCDRATGEEVRSELPEVQGLDVVGAIRSYEMTRAEIREHFGHEQDHRLDAMRYAYSNAIHPVKQRKEQQYHEIIVLIMLVAAGLAAFFLIAPLLHHALFWFYNFVSGKQVPV